MSKDIKGTGLLIKFINKHGVYITTHGITEFVVRVKDLHKVEDEVIEYVLKKNKRPPRK